jgi:hypothetical protein
MHNGCFVAVCVSCLPAAIEEHLLNANVSSIKLNTYVDSGAVQAGSAFDLLFEGVSV